MAGRKYLPKTLQFLSVFRAILVASETYIILNISRGKIFRWQKELMPSVQK